MSNETLFFIQSFIVLCSVLLAGRLGQMWLIALLSAMLVLMNIFVLKQVTLFGMMLTGGNVLYAGVFMTTDMLAEHHGKRAAYRAVRIGFCVSAFFVAMSLLICAYAPNDADWAHASLVTLLQPQLRIVAASMFTYLLVQHLDVYLYGFWKNLTKGRALWLRNNGSTWISQAIDSVMFTLLAFWGEGFPLRNMILFTYALKVIVALLDTPFLYLSKTRVLRPVDATED